MAKLKTLRSERSFDEFIKKDLGVVIIYNYLCPACEYYLNELKAHIDEFSDIPVARIHLNIEWMIKKAKMIGDVQEENMFLTERYRVGNLVPTTLIFSKGELIKQMDGSMDQVTLKKIIDDVRRTIV